MPYDIYGTYQPGYENYWNNNIPVGTQVSGVTICGDGASGWAMPALFKTPTGHYVLFFETDVTENFCGMHLREPSNNVYRLAMPLQAEANNNGPVNPSWTLPWVMPWRVVAVDASPAGILEQTLAFDLATPSMIDDVSWIRPGRASWSWWSNEDVTRYSNVTPFIDMAQQFGWEYSLVDVGWNQMTSGGGGTWQDLVNYAKGKNVSLLFWYNSGGTNSTVNMQPRNRMSSASTRRNEMNTISTAGVKGIKVDFFHADKQWIIQYYLDILRDAAEYKLAVNFHGCTVPRGWQRTYPNLMTMESVRGAEYYKYDGRYPSGQPVRNTILPFTRNAVGSMDYTPVTFTAMANRHITTSGHELALSVMFESGIQHFADRVSAYTSPSSDIRDFLSTVPVAWDDTKYLLGEPGTYLVIARKKGDHWYVGGINGQRNSQSVTVPLSFLPSGVQYSMLRIADGSSNTTFDELQGTVESTGSITVTMSANGGFVVRLKNLDPVRTIRKDKNETIRNHVSMLVSAGSVLRLPAGHKDKLTSVRIFNLNGKMLGSLQMENGRILDLKRMGTGGKGLVIVKLEGY